MTTTTISGLKSEWKPTTFHLSNGHFYFVRHPDYMMLGPNSKTMILFCEPEGDIKAIVDVDQIVSIERQK